MSLKIGIVGLPNVGKSTLFKALTKNPVDISNYPFCTIEPNVGMVPVPVAWNWYETEEPATATGGESAVNMGGSSWAVTDTFSVASGAIPLLAVTVKLEVPHALTPRQRALFEELSRLAGHEPAPAEDKEKGFFKKILG